MSSGSGPAAGAFSLGSIGGSVVGRSNGPIAAGAGLGRAVCWWAVVWILVTGLGRAATAGGFSLRPEEPTLDRWFYPFNFQPGTRPVAPTYGSFDPRFDTRDAEFLLGWDTASVLPTGAGASRYLLRSARVILTSVAPVPPTRPFVYDPTYDSYRTHLNTNDPAAVPDADPGRPVELFGVGFRGGFDAETFKENSPFGPLGPITADTISIGTRNAYAVMFDERGELVDVANHVGQRNAGWTNAPFEVVPWAIGTTTEAEPGEDVPDGARVVFEIDLGDPLVAGHVQEALNAGRLRLMVSSLSPAGQSTPGGTGAGGGGAYPWWSTKENLLYDPPLLEIDGTLVTDEDTDGDGLPDDWERHWFGGLGRGADEDSDGDGSSNAAEWRAGTDPGAAGSVFRTVAYELGVGSGGAWVRFTVAPARVYRVERSSDLRTWEVADGVVTYPERGVAEWRSSAGPGAEVGFLRVRVD